MEVLSLFAPLPNGLQVGDGLLLVDICRIATRSNPNSDHELDLWLAGDESMRVPVQEALARSLGDNEKAVIEVYTFVKAALDRFRAAKGETTPSIEGDSSDDDSRSIASSPRNNEGSGNASTAAYVDAESIASSVSEAHDEAEQSRSRLVSTGLARMDGTVLEPQWILAPGEAYLYWLTIGRLLQPNRVDVGPDQNLSSSMDLRPGMRLRVVLFSFENEIVIDPLRDCGIVELDAVGGAKVVMPVRAEDPSTDRLYFPVRTARSQGQQRLRCSIYHETRLLQSRVLTVAVGDGERLSTKNAVASITDYSVAGNLDSGAAEAAPRLSVFANESGSDSHQFRIYGENGFKGEASIDSAALLEPLGRTRKSLRLASWGKAEEYTDEDTYKYASPVSPASLEQDLIMMARCGRQLWNTLAFALGRGLQGQQPLGKDPALLLRELMRSPGTFEYACPESYRFAMPTALLYDAPLDSEKHLTFCEAARSSLNSTVGNLLDEPCFRGACPHYEDLSVVCPGGFWGFRHAIGLPVSLCTSEGHGPVDASCYIHAEDGPVIAAGLTTDRKFVHMKEHVQRIATLVANEDWRPEYSRDGVLSTLHVLMPHVVYFLCHGGQHDGYPGLLVGSPEDELFITPDNFTEYGIAWTKSTPLVILNGCRTSAFDPTNPSNFVDFLIRRAFASGVIGTEVTIFEQLAERFAELLLEAFLVRRRTLGEAVRDARLELLREGNPLGLVYIPFGPVGLRML